jgi:O-antigen ligase
MVLIEKFSSGGVLGLIYSGQLTEGVRSAAGHDVLYRVGGTFGHPNRLAYYADFMAPLFFCLGFSPEINWKRRLFYFGAFVVAAVCLFLSYSRGGWLASGGALGLCALFLLVRHMRERRFMLLWLFIVTGAVAACGAIAGKAYNRLTKGDAGSTQARLDQFDVTENLIRENPVLGVGVNNFINVAPHYDETGSHITKMFQEPVHNIYLLTWAETGLVGLAIFAFFIFAIFRTGWFWRTAQGPMALWGQGFFFGFLAYFVHAFVDMNRVGSFSLLFFSMGLVSVIKGFADERKARI